MGKHRCCKPLAKQNHHRIFLHLVPLRFLFLYFFVFHRHRLRSILQSAILPIRNQLQRVYQILIESAYQQNYSSCNIKLPGQSRSLQSSLASESPLQTPPLFSTTSLVLVSLRVPLPQVAEHSPIFQALHLQFTGIEISDELNYFAKTFYLMFNCFKKYI